MTHNDWAKEIADNLWGKPELGPLNVRVADALRKAYEQGIRIGVVKAANLMEDYVEELRFKVDREPPEET